MNEAQIKFVTKASNLAGDSYSGRHSISRISESIEHVLAALKRNQ